MVTTAERKPLQVPDSVHVRITPENLKDYVGPPVYHKDRLYVKPPPSGVSTGLGYLGNGSGAVMPIEATVSEALNFSKILILIAILEHAWKGRITAHGKTRRSHPRKRPDRSELGEEPRIRTWDNGGA